MKTAIYARVSTTDQNCAMQLDALRQMCAQRGWTIAEEYIDHGISGAKESRPALDRLLQDAARKRFDIVAVWRFDRMARSVSHLLKVLEALRAYGIDFVSHQECIDTSTPMGKAMFTIIGAFAELERATIRERCKAGIERAKKHGTKSGLPIGRSTRVFRRDLAQEMRTAGKSWTEISAALDGVPVTTIRRALAAGV